LRFAPAKARIGSPEQTPAYLYQIVRNLAFDVLKRRRIEKRQTDGDAPFWLISRGDPTPEESLLFCDQIRIVSKVLSDLPAECRLAVEMHRFGGFTLAEVAEHLNISVATVHRHVRATMLAIASRLD
jgi:RNA polymerase sigma-70 factor (ECF subfamily)